MEEKNSTVGKCVGVGVFAHTNSARAQLIIIAPDIDWSIEGGRGRTKGDRERGGILAARINEGLAMDGSKERERH